MQYSWATIVAKSKAPGSAGGSAEPSVEFTEPARFGRARFLPNVCHGKAKSSLNDFSWCKFKRTCSRNIEKIKTNSQNYGAVVGVCPATQRVHQSIIFGTNTNPQSLQKNGLIYQSINPIRIYFGLAIHQSINPILIKTPPQSYEIQGFIAFLCDNFCNLGLQLQPLTPLLRGHCLQWLVNKH